MPVITRPGAPVTSTVGGAVPVTPGAPAATTTTPTGGTVPTAGGNTVNARKVVVGGLGAARMDASATTNRFARDTSFDTYSGAGDGRVSRGFIKTNATPIPGGARLHVESFHGNHNDAVTLWLLAEVLDTKTNQLRTVTLSVLANGENLNGTSFRGNNYFDISYDDVNKWLQARNPGLKITPGSTNLAVAARWSVGHQAGGFGRGGVFRLPVAANATSAINVRAANATAATSDDADLPLDMQVAYPAALVQAVPKLKADGSTHSRLESELKGATSKSDMEAAVNEAYRLAALVHDGKKADVAKVFGKDWTLEPVNRYWLKDDGTANQPGKAGTGLMKGFRVDERNWPMQDPMRDTYMDDANLAMTRHEGAIRLRTNKTANEINVKPGGGRRDDKTMITQRIEYGLTMTPDANVADASRAMQTIASNSTWSGTVFNQAQREVHKLDATLNLSTALVPWLDVVQDRHKFTLKNEKTGVEIELSLDFVKATTNRPGHANPDGTPKVVEFCVLEAELDHLQLVSANQASFVAASTVNTQHFTTDAEQDTWLKATSPSVTMDIDPRLHELKDLENASFRNTASYKAFEGVSGKMLGALFPNGLESGRQKAAHAAEMLGFVTFDDKKLLAMSQLAIETGGFKWTPALEQAFTTSMATPAQRLRIEQGLANGAAKNVFTWVQQATGAVAALEYDVAKVKDRVKGRLEQLGFAPDASMLAMFDAITTQKVTPQYLDHYLQQMQGVNDAQVLQTFAQVLGVSPAPVPKADLQRLLDGVEHGRAIIARNLETAAVDAKHAAEVEAFLGKAVAAGMTMFEVRTLITNLGSNSQAHLDNLGRARNLVSEVPALKASAKALADRAAPLLTNQLLKVNDELRSFLATLAASRTPQESLQWVTTLQNGAENAVALEAKRLGVRAPKLERDWVAVDAQLTPTLTQVGVLYDDPLKKLVRTAIDAGVPVNTMRGVLSYLASQPLAQALRAHNVYLVGATVPDIAFDSAAIETKIRASLAGYAQALPQTNALRTWIDGLLKKGMTPQHIQTWASYSISYTQTTAQQYSAQQLGGATVSTLAKLPIDETAVGNYWQTRWTTSWTPAIDAFVRANLKQALENPNATLNGVWNASAPRTIAQNIATWSGVPLPAGI